MTAYSRGEKPCVSVLGLETRKGSIREHVKPKGGYLGVLYSLLYPQGLGEYLATEDRST
jgi:hypothetical protein